MQNDIYVKHIMLTYFTYLLSQRSILMAFHSRNIVSFINGIQNNARPFDEILFSFDATNSTSLNHDNDCFDSNTIKICST